MESQENILRTLEQTKNLTDKQVILLTSYACTLEQVMDPCTLTLLEKAEKNKFEEYVVDEYMYMLGKLLKNHKPEQIVNLTGFQIECISIRDCTLEQVTNSGFLKLLKNFERLDPTDKREVGPETKVAWLLGKGYNLEQVMDLNSLQLNALIAPIKYQLTLEKVTHPNFSKALLYTLYETEYDFDTLINLKDWQLVLLQEGQPLEKVVTRTEGATPKPPLIFSDTSASDGESLSKLVIDESLNAEKPTKLEVSSDDEENNSEENRERMKI